MKDDYTSVWMKIANQGVTGSQTKLTVKNGQKHSYLIDDGVLQEGSDSTFANRKHDDIEAIFLTHAHIDHSGALGEFYRENKTSVPIYMTKQTAELVIPMLNDMYNVLAMNGIRPFTREDQANIARVKTNTVGVSVYQNIKLPNIETTFVDNGHILGSVMVGLKAKDAYRDINFLFTGDYREEHPFIRTHGINDYIKNNPVDVLVIETTYGNREDHQPFYDALEELEGILMEGIEKGDVLLGSFSIDRTPVLMYMISQIQRYNKKLAETPVFLDGALAIKGLDIYKSYDYKFKCCLNDIIPENFTIVSDKEMRKFIQNDGAHKIIISTSGQFHGGSIVGHVLKMLPDPTATIVSSGYVAHPVGRAILNANKGDEITYMGRPITVQADIKRLKGTSAHADKSQLARFVERVKSRNPKLKVILTHGTIEAKTAFRDALVSKGIMAYDDVFIQAEDEHFEIDKHTLASGKILVKD